jgi:transcriptional regulator with XRE-family HTH domain
MNHSTWRMRRTRQLAGETVEYDQEYVDARLAGDLGQAVYVLRAELGLSQAESTDRAGMTQLQVSRMEGGDTVPTLPLLRRLAKALDGSLIVAIDTGDAHVISPRALLRFELAKAPDHDRSGASSLVPPAGFEPATPALGVFPGRGCDLRKCSLQCT